MRQDLNGARTVRVFDGEGTQLETFPFLMTGIRSVKGMLQGLWSLIPFSQALSGMNGFSDVDANTEIDGRSLVLEFKQSFKKLNKGQVMKGIRQAKFQKTCTWFIEGQTDTPVRLFQINELNIEGEYQVTEVVDTNLEDIQMRIRSWEKWALANSPVKGNKTGEWEEVNRIIDRVR